MSEQQKQLSILAFFNGSLMTPEATLSEEESKQFFNEMFKYYYGVDDPQAFMDALKIDIQHAFDSVLMSNDRDAMKFLRQALALFPTTENEGGN